MKSHLVKDFEVPILFYVTALGFVFLIRAKNAKKSIEIVFVEACL